MVDKNELGFMSNEIFRTFTSPKIVQPQRWDRQTIVLVANNYDEMHDIINKIRRSKHPQSTCDNSPSYIIDGFVNLNYSVHERNPANRNVRIVYTTKQRIAEISRRMGDAILIVKGGEDDYGTSGVSIQIPEISG